jgi:hypothetical protein
MPFSFGSQKSHLETHQFRLNASNAMLFKMLT